MGDVDQSTDFVRSARALEPDRYLAALLAPRAARDDLVLLAAFLAEIGRVPAIATEPLLGEIRLRWWLDAIDGSAAGGRTGHPLADALGETARRRRLDTGLLAAAVEARMAEVGRGIGDAAAVRAHVAAREEVAFRLAARILGVAEGPPADGALAGAGRAYGLMRLADDGGAEKHEIVRAAGAALAELRENQAEFAHGLVAAILPCALVEPHLRALEGSAGRGVSPLRRAWALWRAHRRKRI